MVIAALLSVVAAMFVSGRSSPAQARADQTRPLLAVERFPADKVNRIVLERRGEPAMSFERSGSGWTQSQPIAFPVESFSIEQLIAQAGQLRVVDSLTVSGSMPGGPGASGAGAGPSAASLSLDPPQALVEYFWPGDSLTLELGRKGVGGRAYLRVAGEPTIYVVNQDLHERALTADPKEWRSRTIFSPAGSEADRVELVSGQERVVLQRDGRRWAMLEPATTRTDATSLDDFFTAVERAQCSGFVMDEPGDPARFGLDNPALSVTIIGPAGTAGPQVQRLLIGSIVGVKGDDRFGMVEGRPVVIRLGAAVLRALLPTREKLASSTATGVDAADVKSLRISGPGGNFQLLRDLDTWSAPDHGDAPVPPKLVAELLHHLTALRATKVVFAEYPRELQVAFVTLNGFDGRPRDTVRIARDAKTGNWAMDDGDNVLRIFPESLKLRLTPGDFGLPDAPAVSPLP